MATVTVRIIAVVIADDGREYVYDATKTGEAPDGTVWPSIVAQALAGLHVEETGEAVATSGLSERF